MITSWHTHRLFAVTVAANLLALLVTTQNARAQGCCSSKSSKPEPASAADCHSDESVVAQRREPAWVPPHGGQIHKSIWNYLEVVYGPQETRIYVYDIFHNPEMARGIQGQAFLRVRSNGGQYRYPLHHIMERNGRDYLTFRVDLTRVRDGDMDVHLDLANMPNREEQTVRFAQVFAMHPSSRAAATAMRVGPNPQFNAVDQRTPARPLAVSISDVTTSDRPAIERQGVCPVMESRLGEHGTPIKLSVDERSLFLMHRKSPPAA